MKIAKNEQKYSRHAPAMCHSQRYYISVYFLQYNYSMSEFRKQRHSLININIIYIYLILASEKEI